MVVVFKETLFNKGKLPVSYLIPLQKYLAYFYRSFKKVKAIHLQLLHLKELKLGSYYKPAILLGCYQFCHTLQWNADNLCSLKFLLFFYTMSQDPVSWHYVAPCFIALCSPLFHPVIMMHNCK